MCEIMISRIQHSMSNYFESSMVISNIATMMPVGPSLILILILTLILLISMTVCGCSLCLQSSTAVD